MKNSLAETSGWSPEARPSHRDQSNQKSETTEILSGHVGRRDFLSQTATLTAGATAGVWSLTGPEHAIADSPRLRSAKL